MFEFLSLLHPWIKALHIISVISWMAGMLYLPRLFVYHCDAAPGSEKSETFKIMERRLLMMIVNPAMIATYLFGIALLLTPGLIDWWEVWIWVKLAAVAVLTWFHHLFSRWRMAFAKDRNTVSARTFRIANEGPTVLMLIIVIMAVVKPL